MLNGINRLVTSLTQTVSGIFFPDGSRGYEDLKGVYVTPTNGATAPTIENFDGTSELGFNASDVMIWLMHEDHTDISGVDKYLHIHVGIASGTTASGSNLVLSATVKHRYHNLLGSGEALRTSSEAAKVFTFTITPAQLNAVKGDTLVVEQLIAQAGGSASLLNSNNWLTDDDISVTFTVTTFPTLTGGTSQKFRFPYADIHRKTMFGGSPRRFFVNSSFWN